MMTRTNIRAQAYTVLLIASMHSNWNLATTKTQESEAIVKILCYKVPTMKAFLTSSTH